MAFLLIGKCFGALHLNLLDIICYKYLWCPAPYFNGWVIVFT